MFGNFIPFTLSLFCFFLASIHAVDFKYHTNEELHLFLKNFTENSPRLAKMYSIGKTRSGTDLTVVQISAAKDNKLGVPNIKFIGNIHGNEAVGREILLHYLEFLRDNYNKPDQRRVTWLLNNTRIHILPSLNPDGFELSNIGDCVGETGRANHKQGEDLNRNFPDYYTKNTRPVQPETLAIMKWMNEIPFILSAGLHGGALVANYPFETVKKISSTPTYPASLTADDDVFIHLAKTYANNHETMHKGEPCPDGRYKFPGGITNGASWYPLIGGMQDYNYAMRGCMELTLEISCCKYPWYTELPKLWNQNKKALFEFSYQALIGVTGQITDLTTNEPIQGASLKIVGRNMTFNSTKTGEFWRLLLPGTYRLEVKAPGYYPQVVPFKVRKSEFPTMTFLEIKLLNSGYATTTTSTEKITTTKRTVKISNRSGYQQDEDNVTTVIAKQVSKSLASRPFSKMFVYNVYCASAMLLIYFVL